MGTHYTSFPFQTSLLQEKHFFLDSSVDKGEGGPWARKRKLSNSYLAEEKPSKRMLDRERSFVEDNV